jgi:hypothetical protein
MDILCFNLTFTITSPNSCKNISQNIVRVRKFYNLAYTKIGPSKNEFSSFLKLGSFGSAKAKTKVHDA